MLKRSFVAMLTAATLFGSHAASAQNFPSKPIRILTGEAGGPNDFVGRLLAKGMTENGIPTTLENLKGAETSTTTVKAAEPDGYTILDVGSVLWLLPFMRDSVAWDPLKDFAPIMLTTAAPNVLAVNPSVPAKTVQELLALAKTKDIVSATGPAASGTNLASQMFKAMTGANIGHKVYSGNVPALNAVLSGETQMMFVTMGAVIPEIKAGKLRGLAVTGDKPFELLPDLPTVASSGLAGFEAVAMTGFFAPKNTPPAVIKRLNEEMARVLNTPEAKKALLDRGVQIVASSPEELTAKMTSEMNRLGKVIKDAGIKD